MNLSEQIHRIKEMMFLNEQISPSVAASGPQKCGLTKGADKDNCEKETKLWDREVARQDKIDARQRSIENKNFLSLSYDRNSSPLDRESKKLYNSQYQSFVKNNPSLLSSSEGFDSEEKYAIISKTLDFIKRVPEISYSVNLRSKYGLNPTSTLTDVVEVVNQMGGWENYMNWFNSGGPKLK